MIYVTQPDLPPLEEFIPYLRQIWDSRVLTNCGPMHFEFERQLGVYLGSPYVSVFNNGTNALLTALQALDLSGEVITTPYSFSATVHSIVRNGLTPVFVDIDPATFNMDPNRIEAAITPATSAILPVHCYGWPCDVRRIGEIARHHQLKLVYDAAHAFGVRLDGVSPLDFGDLSVLSFHATKVFNTIEGGAVVSHSPELKQRVDRLKNFGIVDEVTVVAAGTNGKMNEIQAALGLLQLIRVDAAIARRMEIVRRYRSLLSGLDGISIPTPPDQVIENGSYFPILVGAGYPLSRDALFETLRSAGIYARRYFYPLLSDLPMYRQLPSAAPENLPNANLAARQVLCLPVHTGLTDGDVVHIASLISGKGRP